MPKVKRPMEAQARRSAAPDWDQLFEVFDDVIEWALDLAVKLSRGYDEDVDAVENVRAFFRAWRDGEPCDVPVTDVLMTIATILSAIELDLGIESVSLLAPLRSAIEGPLGLPPMLHLPGATPPEPRIHRIRRPRYRNGGALHTRLAA
jgi:hypothetical protein